MFLSAMTAWKRPMNLALTFVLWLPSLAGAQMTSTTETYNTSGSEYFVGRDLGRPLITVNLLSGVSRPGVYHIPLKTNLPQLIDRKSTRLNSSHTDISS